jgi:ribosomal protein S21
MTKQEKKQRAQLAGGIGANVVDGDLGLAIRTWKQDLKNSGILKEIYKKREFVSKSKQRKEIVDKAKYRTKFENSSQNK